MKKFTIWLLLCTIFAPLAFAQSEKEEPIHVRVFFNDKYRYLRLTEEVKNYLFVKERATHSNFNDDYDAYFVDIDSVSAQKLGTETIVVIFGLDKLRYAQVAKVNGVELDILPLHPDWSNVYYMAPLSYLPIEKRRENERYRFWENPTAHDTLSNLIIGSPLELTPLYIKALDMDKTVYQETITFQLTETDYVPKFTYPAYNIATMARATLESLERRNLDLPKKGASPATWRFWYDNLPKQMKLSSPTADYQEFTTNPQMSVYSDIFMQKGDSIYGYTDDSVFVLNTKTLEFSRKTPAEIPYKTFDGPIYKEQERNASTNKLYDVLHESDYNGQWRYVDSKNGDIIVARMTYTKFQHVVSLHRLPRGLYRLTKGVTVRTLLPLEDDDYNSLKVVGLFETATHYVVISRAGVRKRWQLIPKTALKANVGTGSGNMKA